MADPQDRLARICESLSLSRSSGRAWPGYQDDIRWLVAEVERLRAENARYAELAGALTAEVERLRAENRELRAMVFARDNRHD